MSDDSGAEAGRRQIGVGVRSSGTTALGGSRADEAAATLHAVAGHRVPASSNSPAWS